MLNEMVNYCGKCGIKLTEDMNFYHQCGSSVIDVSNPSIQMATKSKKTKFASLPTNCSNWGAPLKVSVEDVIRTCQYCGMSILVTS